MAKLTPPKHENEATKATLVQLSATIARQGKQLDEMTQVMARQGDQLEQVLKMLRRRETQLKASERENRKLRRMLGLDDPDPEPDASPLPGDPDAEGSADPEEAGPGGGSKTTKASAEADDDGDELAVPAKKPRPRSSGGRRPPPPHLPTEVESHEVCACGLCGAGVLKRDVLTSRMYTIIAEHVRCREIRRERVLCTNPECNNPTTAPMPPMPCERALYDCNFIAWLVVMKFVLLVPLDRIRLLLLSQGVDLAMGSLVHLIERAANLADVVDGEHMKQLRRGAWMSFDGTGLKTLVPGQDKAWDGYLEVFVRDEITVFQFDLTKHADALKERIGEFTGILVCDAESRNAAGAAKATFANCNAHAVRKFEEAERVQPKLAAQGRRFLRALYDLEDEAESVGLTEDRLVAFRQRRSRRVLKRFRQWLEGVLRRPLPPSDPVAKVAKYYVKHWDDLTRFIDHADLPLDNNAAEREFQRHAKLRYASLFAGSPEGGHRWATLFGVVRTAQKCDVDVMSYLTWLFERRGTHRARFGMSAAELTPMAYRSAGCPGAVQAAA